jgi:hypothetical protein
VTLLGVSARFWCFAILIETGANLGRNVEQQSSRPQVPMPPVILASSRTPTCRSSIRVWSLAASSRTSSRKSMRSSEAK